MTALILCPAGAQGKRSAERHHHMRWQHDSERNALGAQPKGCTWTMKDSEAEVSLHDLQPFGSIFWPLRSHRLHAVAGGRHRTL